MGGRICFRLNICRWHFGNPGNLDRMFILILGEESFETNLIAVFVYVMVDCILCQNAFNRLIVSELGFVLQRGKIVASIEQKPVSLNDIVTCRALIKTESDF